MGETTKIQWADSTVNPVMGCDGCELWNGENKTCYAGISTQNKVTKGPIKGWPSSFDVPTEFPGRMAKAAKWKDLRGITRPDKPWIPPSMPRLVFISDMGDALSRSIPFGYLKKEIVDVVAQWPHIGMWLTKQPKRMAEFSRWLKAEEGIDWPKNLWCGTSVTSNKTQWRIGYLLNVGGENTTRFLSCEPIFELINLGFNRPPRAGGQIMPGPLGIRLVIIGGASGKHAAPCSVEWIRDMQEQTVNAGANVFTKQLGSNVINELTRNPIPPPWPNGVTFDSKARAFLSDSHGGDWNEWPADLRVRQFPKVAL